MEMVVQTRTGAVRGSSVNGIASFTGIPYAAPPFGPRRFLPPQPAKAWEGIRDALVYGPTAPKAPYAPPADTLLPEPAQPGEECLNLNIWTPDAGAAGLPVMVWIHGGAFVNGSGMIATYDGVVCVTINYRLGIEGFLYLGEQTANLGLLDQVAALEWVQENISAFGGNPDNVTIFGESAGGMSVTTLLSMPRAAGLFRRVIAQSGAGYHALLLDTARLIAHYLAKKLGVAPTPEAFASLPGERLLAAQVELGNEMSTNPDPQRWREALTILMIHGPVIDGDILPDLPARLLARGAGVGVEVMTGSTTDEYNLFLVPAGLLNQLNEEALVGLCKGYGISLEEAIATYCDLCPGATPGELFSALATDWVFRIPALRLVEARVTHGEPAYLHEFAWRSPLFEGRLGSCHTLELAFVFDNLHLDENKNLLGAAPPQALASAMHAAWVSFASSGDPGWPRYDFARRATMRFAMPSDVVDDPHATARTFWEGRR